MKNRVKILGIVAFVACLMFVSFASAAYISPSLMASEDSQLVSVRVDYHGQEPTQQAFDSVVAKIGKEVKEKYFPEGFVVQLSGSEVKALGNSKDISYIQPALTFTISDDDTVNITRADDIWPITLSDGHKLTGVGQTIVIVDTGIDFNHPDLASHNIAGVEFDCYNFVNCDGSASVTDLNGHGTHVAGIAAASGDVKGIAPGADLIALKMFPGSGSSFTDTVAMERALNWTVNHKDQYNLSVVSMSVASNGWFAGACDVNFPTLAAAVNNANSHGIAVVISTGNNYKTDRISVPSCMSNAIPVAASNKDGTLASYSNRDSFVKLAVPGTNVLSTCKGGGYCVKSGTSMATPIVSASFALVNQYLESKDKTMTPKEIEKLLSSTGNKLSNQVDNLQLRSIDLVKAFFRLGIFTQKISQDGNIHVGIAQGCTSASC